MIRRNEIEPKIKPLVDAINALGLFRTFSSCEGHYTPEEQELQDKNKADVRFRPLESTPLSSTEHFITYLMTEFNNRHSFTPIQLVGYKQYTPDEEYKPDYVFVIKLEPFDRFDSPNKKRRDTDIAIQQATEVVMEYTKLFL